MMTPDHDATPSLDQALAWADGAAVRGDYAGALRWLYTAEMDGHALPAAYLDKREEWRSALNEPPERTESREA
jgi:hypothetical protein